MGEARVRRTGPVLNFTRICEGSAIRNTSFLVRSFATPRADYSACQWGVNTVRRGRRLFGEAVGGTVSVLIPAATGIKLGTATIGRSVVAPFFQATTGVGPTGLRGCGRSGANQQQRGN